MSAIGGMNVTETVEGLERYPVNIRYPRELRDNPEQLRRVLIATPYGAQIPLGQIADIDLQHHPYVVLVDVKLGHVVRAHGARQVDPVCGCRRGPKKSQ